MREQLEWYDDVADNPLDQRPSRGAAASNARGLLLSTRPGDHRCDRPVRREGARQPRLLSQQAVLALPLLRAPQPITRDKRRTNGPAQRPTKRPTRFFGRLLTR